MPQKRRQRLKWTLTLIAGGLIGATLAVFIAMVLAIKVAGTELHNYAVEFLEQDERIASNIDAIVAAGNTSPYPECSEQDLQFLRELLFRSPYTKDIGRPRGNALLCSAVIGRLPVPLERKRTAQTTYRNRDIYYNVDLAIAPGQRAEVIAEGKTNVVVSPDIFSEFSRPPMLFAGAIVDHQKKHVLQMYSSSSHQLPLDLLLSDKPVRRHGMLYHPHCSSTRPDCVLTAISIRDVRRQSMPFLVAAALLGAAVAALIILYVGLIRRRHRTLSAQLRRAIQRRQLEVLYQPIVEVSTGRVACCEALARWRDEDAVPIRPEVFISIAEEHGFIRDLTDVVVERVASDTRTLLAEHPGFRVSINISAYDLADPGFPERLQELLATSGVVANNIGLELTERSTTDKEIVVEAIRKLRSFGHVIYIDDFGTGYSSLGYLHELSVNMLKVDRVFTNTIGTDSITSAILPQILSMAAALELGIVIEGVEHQEQADFLRSQEGQIFAQGWFYGKPMPIHQLRAHVASTHQHS